MLLAAALGFAAPIHSAYADISVADLSEKLEQASDFRMRVQAALELGKTTADKEAARVALEAALGDPNAAVRAAAAAALKVLADTRALPALRRAEQDSSAPVVAQIRSTIQTLRARNAAASSRPDLNSERAPRVLVQVGKVRNATPRPVRGLVRDFKRRSEEQLQALSGVEVLPAKEDSAATAKRLNVPVVMLTGHLKQLQQTEEDGNVVYAARVEYVLFRMPGNNLRAVISGTAKVKGSDLEDAQPSLVRLEAINAAIDSAMKRAREALVAAVQ